MKVMLYTAVGAAAFVALAVLYGLGYTAGTDSVIARWEEERAIHAAAQAKREAEFRRREREWNDEIRQITEAGTQALVATEAQYRDALADSESGALRLREQFRGCQQRLSQTPSPTPSSNGTDSGGLSRTDETAFIRLARDADVCAGRLTQAQDYINTVVGDEDGQ